MIIWRRESYRTSDIIPHQSHHNSKNGFAIQLPFVKFIVTNAVLPLRILIVFIIHSCGRPPPLNGNLIASCTFPARSSHTLETAAKCRQPEIPIALLRRSKQASTTWSMGRKWAKPSMNAGSAMNNNNNCGVWIVSIVCKKELKQNPWSSLLPLIAAFLMAWLRVIIVFKFISQNEHQLDHKLPISAMSPLNHHVKFT